MEIIIEEMSMIGFSKVLTAFQKYIKEYHVNVGTDTITVFFNDSELWEVSTFTWGVSIKNLKNDISITIANHHFKNITIQ